MKLWTFEDGKLVEGIAVWELSDGRRVIPVRVISGTRNDPKHYLLLSREDPPEVRDGHVHRAEFGYFVPEQEIRGGVDIPDVRWYTLRDGGDEVEQLVAFQWAGRPKFQVDLHGTAGSRLLEVEDLQPAPPHPSDEHAGTPTCILLIVGIEDDVRVFPYGQDDRDRAWVLSNSPDVDYGVDYGFEAIPLKEWGDDDPEKNGHCVA